MNDQEAMYKALFEREKERQDGDYSDDFLKGWQAALEWLKSGQESVAFVDANGDLIPKTKLAPWTNLHIHPTPAQPVRLTEDEVLTAIVNVARKPYEHTQRLTYDSGPYEVTKLSMTGLKIANAIQDAMLAKGAGQPSIHQYRGYALLGSGNYILSRSADFDPQLGAELIITFATEQEKKDRKVGEMIENPNNLEPIEADDMVIRIGFLNERGLFALEKQLALIRNQFFSDDTNGLPAQPVVGSNSYVQPVPDHCDRIIWRNSYYNLPIKNTQSAVVQQLVEALESVRDRIRPGTEKRLKVEAALKAAKEQGK